jgi:putative membrane protein
MMIGFLLIDLIIPLDFPKEIQEGNKAVGWVAAGIYTGLGFIIRSAIISFEASKGVDLLQGVIETLIYSLVGIIAFAVGYFAVDIVNKKFNFNEELKNKNEAAGIMIFGIFLGVAFVVSGVIQ